MSSEKKMISLIITAAAISVSILSCGHSSVIDEIYREKITRLGQFLESGVHPDKGNIDGEKPLCTASRYNSPEHAEMLIHKGAGVNCLCRNDEPVLNLAIRFDSAEIVKLLVDNGSKFQKRDINSGDTPLHEAAAGGNPEIFKYLVKKGADINVKNSDGDSPIHKASGHSLEIASFLIESGVNVNIKNKHGETPLHLAAKSRNAVTIEYLITHGADVNSRTKFNGTPLNYASHMPLLKYESKSRIEMRIKKYIDTATILVRNGADLNSQNSDKETPVFGMFYKGWPNEAIIFLIKNGAKVNVKNSSGKTSLHLAVERNNKSMVKFLIDKGAKVDKADKSGETPIALAERLKLKEILLILKNYYRETK